VRKVAYLKKVAVPRNGTVEKIAIGKLEKRILENAANNNNIVWQIAEKFSYSISYINNVYQTVRKLEDKGLIEINFNGQKGGLTITLTDKAKEVLKIIDELKQIDKKDSDKRICAPYETC
jgi:DNA-binding MarR family transcriptional regulator